MQAPEHPGQVAAEIHVPIAPTPGFRTRARLLAASVRANAGAFADAPIVAWVSRDVEPFALEASEPWSRELGVEWRWVEAADHERWGMYGTALLRFTADFHAPYVVMLDADVIVTGDLGPLRELTGDGIGGVIAHISPAMFPQEWHDGRARVEGEEYWHQLYGALDLPPPDLSNVHPAWGVLDVHPDRRRCPGYLNLGVLAGRVESMRTVGAGIMDELDRVSSVVATPMRCQLAVMAQLARSGIPAVPLGLRWNMPNQLRTALAHPVEIEDVRVLHYMYEDQLHRDRDFGSVEAIEQIAGHRGLDEVNEYLRSEVLVLDLRVDPAEEARRRAPGAGGPQAEIHVPIAPTEGFRTRLRLLAASVRRYGGSFADAPIVAWVSRDVEPFDLAEAEPWSRDAGVEWRWVDESDYRRWGMYGTALLRFTADFRAPYVVMLDADTVMAGAFDELPALTGDGIGGCIAHVSPAAYDPPWSDGAPPRHGPDFWRDLFAQVGLPEPVMSSVHPGFGILDGAPARRSCPHYFNLGMIAGTAAAMRTIGGVIMDELDNVERTVETWTRCQLAVALAVARTGVGAVDLGMRWNAPNDVSILAAAPADARDVRLLHYLREDEVHRERDLGSIAALERLVDRDDLQYPDELLRRIVAAVLPTLTEGTAVAHR